MKFIRKLGKKLRDELEKQGKEIKKFQKSQSIRLKKLQKAESKLQRKQSYQNNLFTGLMTKESLQIQKNATYFAPGMRGKKNSSTSLGNFDNKNIQRKTKSSNKIELTPIKNNTITSIRATDSNGGTNLKKKPHVNRFQKSSTMIHSSIQSSPLGSNQIASNNTKPLQRSL